MAKRAHNVSVKSQGLHPADRAGVMAEFGRVAAHVFNAFDSGTARTRGFFAEQPTEDERQRNVFLAADLTRFWACSYLTGWDLEARLDRIWLPNNGVALRHGLLDIRCLKSRSGAIPRPGPSRLKRAFLNQAIQDNIFLLDPDHPRAEATVNLIVTWTVDAQGNLIQLNVHSPAWANRETVGVYWSEPLMHPAETFEPEPEPEPEDFIEPEELPGYDKEGPDEITGTISG